MSLEFYTKTLYEKGNGVLTDAVMLITTENDARAFYLGYLEFMRLQGMDGVAAEAVAQGNIGWCFGAGMSTAMVAAWHRVIGPGVPVHSRHAEVEVRLREALVQYVAHLAETMMYAAQALEGSSESEPRDVMLLNTIRNQAEHLQQMMEILDAELRRKGWR